MYKPEQIAHIIVMDWARSRGDIEPFIFHFANERSCSPKEGQILKRMGVKRGVSDFFICCPRGGFSGLWIELKVGNNKPTPEQYEFIHLMNSQNYLAMWRTGEDPKTAAENVKKEIIDYLSLTDS